MLNFVTCTGCERCIRIFFSMSNCCCGMCNLSHLLHFVQVYPTESTESYKSVKLTLHPFVKEASSPLGESLCLLIIIETNVNIKTIIWHSVLL